MTLMNALSLQINDNNDILTTTILWIVPQPHVPQEFLSILLDCKSVPGERFIQAETPEILPLMIAIMEMIRSWRVPGRFE